MSNFEKLKEAVGELEEDEVYAFLHKVMEDGGTEAGRAMEACQQGMELVGRRFEEGEYFVGDLIYAGEIMTEAVNILKSAIAEGDQDVKGKMLICTVKDDLHDIGKNIVKAMLSANGFDVLDLGIDVPAKQIVQTVQDNDLKIVALSGVLTLALDSMKATVDALREAGLTDVHVIIGGAPTNEEACRRVGADAWAHNPQDTVRICRQWAS